jgi:hypothetical protein
MEEKTRTRCRTALWQWQQRDCYQQRVWGDPACPGKETWQEDTVADDHGYNYYHNPSCTFSDGNNRVYPLKCRECLFRLDEQMWSPGSILTLALTDMVSVLRPFMRARERGASLECWYHRIPVSMEMSNLTVSPWLMVMVLGRSPLPPIPWRRISTTYVPGERATE